MNRFYSGFEESIIEDHDLVSEHQSAFRFMQDLLTKDKSLCVAIIGATGVVGRTLVRVLKERDFPVGELLLFASENTEDHWVETPFGNIPVVKLNPRKPPVVDFAFIAAGASVAKSWGWRLSRQGAIVIDKSSYFRLRSYVPLIIPEVNSHALKDHQGIIANPNCTTIPVVHALAPLHKAFGLKSLTAVSFQSVSGSGKAGLEAFERELLDPELEASYFTHRIAGNVIPWIGDSGTAVSAEESKLIRETRKILDLPRLPIRVTSVRVPTRIGHGIAVHADFWKDVKLSVAQRKLENFPGLVVIDDPQKHIFPTPLDVTGRDETFVGRLRRDRGRKGLAFWVCADNLRKGAATNAVQIAEVLINKAMD